MIQEKLQRKSQWVKLLLFMLLLLVGLGLLFLAERQPTVPDSIGYIVAGTNFGTGQGLRFADAHNTTTGPFFYLHAFRMVEQGATEATFGYPPGFPWLIGLAVAVTRQTAVAYYIVPALGILLLLLTYWLGMLVSQNQWVALGGAALLASTALFWQFSSAPWSEIPSAVFLVGGVGCFLQSRRSLADGKNSALFSVLAGILIGYSFLIRYTNAILVLPGLLNYELYTARLGILRETRRWLFFGVVGLFAGLVLLVNWQMLGGPFNSIYSTPSLGAYPWSYFSLSYAFGRSPVNGFSFLRGIETVWHNFYLLLILIPVGLVWHKRSYQLLLGGICLATFVLYSVYAFAPTEINARFLLPLFPFLAVLLADTAVSLIQTFVTRRYTRILILLAIVGLAASATIQVERLQARNAANAAMVARTQQLTAQVPPNSVWLSSGLNDLIFVYGKQSALNFRRMIVVDANRGMFDMTRFESCLVSAVDNLLAADTPVYYVEESGWGTAELMDTYFLLSPVSFHQNTFHIDSPSPVASRNNLPPCD